MFGNHRLKVAIAVLLITILMINLPSQELFSTQNQSVQMIAGVRSTDTLETIHFNVSYASGQDSYAKMIGDLAERVYAESIEFANYTPQERILINIVESNDFNGLWLNMGGFEGMNIAFQCEWSIDWEDGFVMKQAVAHELNHVLLSRKRNETYIHNILPYWYCEGSADYFSLRYISQESEIINKIRLISYNEIGNFKSLDQMKYSSSYNLQAYVEGYSVFKFIEHKYGNQTLRRFQDNMEQYQDTSQAIEDTFEIAQIQFEENWVDWLFNNYTVGVNLEPTIFGYPLTDSYTQDYAGKVPSSWHNGKILYVSDKHGNLDIFVMNENGTGVERLTDNNFIDSDPKWSPDGTKILFTSNRGMNFGVYIMNMDGSNVIPLVDDQYVNLAETWSPDGKEILFISSRKGNCDIFSIQLDGSGLIQLTTDNGSDGGPTYSPDGSSIIFVSNRTGKYELFMMNIDGSGITKLTSFQGEFQNVANPFWSPDGKYVMFELKESWFSSLIYRMDISNFESEIIIEPLSNNSYTNVRNPIWSEKGNEIVFTSGGEIYRYEVLDISQKRTDYVIPTVIISIIGVIAIGAVIMVRKHKTFPPPENHT